MKKRACGIVLYFVLALVLTTSCEKGYYLIGTEDIENMEMPEGEGTDNSESGGDSGSQGGDSQGGGTNIDGEMLTVAQFMEQALTGQQWVVGYVVGACTQTIDNADFEPPFDNPQALLLADTYGETDKGKVITIGLPSGSKARKELNLVDHPENYGKRIAFYGEQATYLKVKGMKKPDDWRVLDE